MSSLFDSYVENSDLDACVDTVISQLEALRCGSAVMTDGEKTEVTELFRKWSEEKR